LQAIQYEIEVAQKKRECEVHVKLWGKGKSVLYMGVIRENVESMWITVDSSLGGDCMPVEDIIEVQIAE